MKEYILNESPIKTTNNFNVNRVKLNLEIPKINSFKDIIIDSKDIIISENKNKSKMTSKIGLNLDTSYEVNITVPKGIEINEPVIINYEFTKEDNLISNFNITYEENSKADFIFRFKSNNKEKNINYFKENITANKNSKGSISIINLLNDESYSFIEIEGNIKENTNINHNIIDLGGQIKLSNVDINLNDYKSSHNLNSIYIGTKQDIIDITYYIKNYGPSSNNIINTEGVLTDQSKKTFKGIIDFKEESKKSTGKENENCIILNDEVISRSLPTLLCHEEDVDGAHGVSSGKIDNEKLFYLMSRGYSVKEASKLIIYGNFNKIISQIPSEKIVKEVFEVIDNIL